MKTVAFVPIRLNSKRVVGKNLRQLGGKPLLAYILDTLVEVKNVDEVYVFCSDPSIQGILPDGVKFLQRDEALDRDETLGEEIYDAFVSQVEADIYVLAHTTSPFIKSRTIECALGKVEDGECDSAFSVEKLQTFTWYRGRPLNYSLDKIPRTQTIEPVFVETSAFYIFKRDIWVKHHQRIGFKPYMAVIDKVEGVDIDWPDDFAFAEQVCNVIKGK